MRGISEPGEMDGDGGIRHAKEAADAECRGWIKEANRGTCAMRDNALQRV